MSAHLSSLSHLVILIHVFQVVFLTDEQVQVFLPVSMDCLHMSLTDIIECGHFITKKRFYEWNGPRIRLKGVEGRDRYLNNVLPWMPRGNQLLSVVIHLGDSSLFRLQTFTDEGLLGRDRC